VGGVGGEGAFVGFVLVWFKDHFLILLQSPLSLNIRLLNYHLLRKLLRHIKNIHLK
jgi:hypothetical protein